MLRSGRRVIDPTAHLAGVRIAVRRSTGLYVVLEGIAEFTKVMPETREVSPIAATER
jgi:hypothetical protein